MPLFTVEEVLKITGARLLSGTRVRSIRRLCTDSRSVRSGDLFIALTGERFDGHQFVGDALRMGAVGALVSGAFKPPGARSGARGAGRSAAPVMLAVPDTLAAYQDLAAHHRRRFRIPVVAVTGSNGKTSTKEMAARVLAERWRILKTEGNLNNRIGVPQTVLQLTARHQAAVIEMGVDQKGQTTRLGQIAQPTVGVITNVGPDHLEFFGSLQASADAKGELLDLLPRDGAAVLNADDGHFDRLASRARCRIVSFGLGRRAQVRATDAVADARRGTAFRLTLPGVSSRPRVVLPAYGTHNVSNALAAAAVGHILNVSPAAIVRGLGRFRPVAMRSQVSTYRGIRIINDCYNANPASMKAAIDLLRQLGVGRRTIAVLGDMLELGPATPALHREIGAYLTAHGVSHLVACGTLARGIAEGARAAGMPADCVREVPDAAAAAVALQAVVRSGDVVLVKASRGVRLEQALAPMTGKRRVPKH
jgi:UDP-N-acetylmuramoyl-tripeptide--D-alanyl-D-alanine ligase